MLRTDHTRWIQQSICMWRVCQLKSWEVAGNVLWLSTRPHTHAHAHTNLYLARRHGTDRRRYVLYFSFHSSGCSIASARVVIALNWPVSWNYKWMKGVTSLTNCGFSARFFVHCIVVYMRARRHTMVPLGPVSYSLIRRVWLFDSRRYCWPSIKVSVDSVPPGRQASDLHAVQRWWNTWRVPVGYKDSIGRPADPPTDPPHYGPHYTDWDSATGDWCS